MSTPAKKIARLCQVLWVLSGIERYHEGLEKHYDDEFLW
jgi:hypothetical protein